MPDSKITALASTGTGTDPANDPLVIVDVSDTSMAASGTTKKVTLNNLLACSPTATLASATITGDLTVATNRLVVNASGICIGTTTATPFAGNVKTVVGAGTGAIGLTLYGGTASTSGYYFADGIVGNETYRGYVEYSHTTDSFAFGTAGTNRYTIDSTGIATWLVAGTTAMTLNSTGLGVGATPIAKLHVKVTGGSDDTLLSYGANQDNFYTAGSSGVHIFRNLGTERFRIDSSGNVGVGITPSAWGAGNKFIDINSSAAFGAFGASDAMMIGNAYWNGSSWIRKTANNAWRFVIESVSSTPTMTWQLAANGSAGSSITWTQAMTLTASGDLLVGTTGLNATWNTRLTLSSDSGTTRWAVGPYSTATNFVISGASGGGVYLNGTAATSWTSASDERLKDIIEPISNAVSKIGSLRSVIGKFKTDSEGTRRSFLIAQDVQSVLPEAVDASNPDRLGVAYTDVIPLLVAAIKELTARVEALEA